MEAQQEAESAGPGRASSAGPTGLATLEEDARAVRAPVGWVVAVAGQVGGREALKADDPAVFGRALGTVPGRQERMKG